MKKVLVLLLTGIASFAYAQRPIVPQNRETHELIGNVKSVMSKNGSLLQDGSRYESLHKFHEYNTSGNQVLEKFIYDIKKNLFTHNVLRYDDAQNLVEVHLYSDSVLAERRVYAYDSNNRVIQETLFNGNGGMTQKSLFTYNVQGLISEKHLWMSDTYFLLKQVYEYDKNGNNTSLKNYIRDNKLTYEYHYQYDANNNKVHQTSKKLNDPLVQTVKMTYDGRNNLLKTMHYNNDKPESEVSYVYDNDGLKTEAIFVGNEKKTKSIWRYNEKGLATETLEYADEVLTTKQTYQYEYDAVGNWTKKYTSRDDGRPSFEERGITYF